MKSIAALFFIIFCLMFIRANTLVAQNIQSLTKESIYKVKYDQNDTAWQNKSKSILAYDDQGRITKRASYDYTLSGNWKLDNTSSTVYDENGRTIYKSWVRYDNAKNTKASQTFEYYDYKEHQETVRRIELSFESNYHNEYTSLQQYDQKGHLIKSEFTTTSLQNGETSESQGSSHYYYDNNDCSIGYSQFFYSKYSNGQVYENYDSTSIEYYDVPQCVELTRTSWSKDNSSGEYKVRFVRSYERDFDENFNETKTINRWQSEDSDWEWKIERQIKRVFNDNNVMIELKSWTSTEKGFVNYNDNGDLIFQLIQVYDTSESTWKNQYERRQEFTEFGGVLYTLDQSDFNSDGIYDSRQERFYKYTEENTLDIILNNGQETDPETGEVISYTKQSKYYYRCDGLIKAMERTTIDGFDPYAVYPEDRFEYTYYNMAPCQQPPDKKNLVKIAPNPTNYYVNIIANKPLGNSKVQIITTSGQILLEEDYILNNYASIDLRGYKPGIYLIRIQNDNAEITDKLIVR